MEYMENCKPVLVTDEPSEFSPGVLVTDETKRSFAGVGSSRSVLVTDQALAQATVCKMQKGPQPFLARGLLPVLRRASQGLRESVQGFEPRSGQRPSARPACPRTA